MSFKCHLSVHFSQKPNFIDYSGYFKGEVAAILDYARVGPPSRKFMLAERMDLFILSFWSTVPNLVLLSAR